MDALHYRANSRTQNLLVYWSEVAATTAATVAVVRRIQPSLGVTTSIGLGCALYSPFVLANKSDHAIALMGPIAGLQFGLWANQRPLPFGSYRKLILTGTFPSVLEGMLIKATVMTLWCLR